MQQPTGSGLYGWYNATLAAELVDVEEFLEVEFIVQLVSLAPFTVLLYEYLITFDREVQYAWDRKLTWATSVFFLNRYLSIFEALAALVSVPSPGDYFNCVVISRIVDTTTAMQYVVWAVFAGLRVYAISEGSKTIASLVVFLALIPPTTINIISAAFTVYFVEAEEPLPVPICFKGGSLTDRDALSLSVVGRASLILSEAIVLLVVVERAWLAYRRQRKLMSLTSLVFQEGIYYFLARLLLDSANLVATIFPDSVSYGLVLVFLDIIPPILISRFYFSLDDWDRGSYQR